jgi:Zn-dependent metalloprotease
MASFTCQTLLTDIPLHRCGSDHVCSIVPDYLLQDLVDSDSAPEHARVCAQRTLTHTRMLRAARSALMYDHAGHAGHSIIPSYMLQDVIDSDQASEEDKERARKSLAHSQAIRKARAGVSGDAAPQRRLNRIIYDTEQSNDLPGDRVRKEGQVATQDISTNQVYDFFKNTYDFYFEVFNRDSIDNLGMSLIGSVHFDDLEPPPGFNNAFWNGHQMVFGDGDGIMFASFTKCLDVIAHELTHGVTQYTARLPYHQQSGALNEHMSDVFGSMVKQYSLNKQEAKDADWLIGEGIFAPGFQGRALRDMKAPGTAYNDPQLRIKDKQVGHMGQYVHLPDDDNPRNDSGGVHINSGIPNRAFYLAAAALGGHSWDKAGPIWYKTLQDPRLRRFASDPRNYDDCFPTFAGITCARALGYGSDVQEVVKKAWIDVGVTPKEASLGSAGKGHGGSGEL